jgi:hypothetical protein
MDILVVGGLILGMILGLFFKWYILVPASGFAIVLVLANPARTEHSVLGWFLQIYLVTTSIQIGYVVGAAS